MPTGGFARMSATYSKDPLNKSPRPSHLRNGRMTALSFAVNSTAIDSKYRLVLHPVPWRAGSRDLSRGSLNWDIDFRRQNRFTARPFLCVMVVY